MKKKTNEKPYKSPSNSTYRVVQKSGHPNYFNHFFTVITRNVLCINTNLCVQKKEYCSTAIIIFLLSQTLIKHRSSFVIRPIVNDA